MTTIRIEDARKIGYCIKAQKQWFEKHDLDFRDYVKNGIEWSKIEHIDDAILEKVYVESQRREAEVSQNG